MTGIDDDVSGRNAGFFLQLVADSGEEAVADATNPANRNRIQSDQDGEGVPLFQYQGFGIAGIIDGTCGAISDLDFGGTSTQPGMSMEKWNQERRQKEKA
jgi:hypothetical protein